MSKEIERRYYKAEIRAAEGEQLKLSGYGAIFNGLSDDLGGFVERIHPDAFDGRLDDDVRALFNHDSRYVLGRTKSGTLSLDVDSNGLRYEVTPPNSQTIRDLVIEPMQRGDIDQSSFAFSVLDDSWDVIEDQLIRTVLKFERLYDVSPVTFPAYPGASSAVSQRALARCEDLLKSKQARHLTQLDELQRRLQLIKIGA